MGGGTDFNQFLFPFRVCSILAFLYQRYKLNAWKQISFCEDCSSICISALYFKGGGSF